MKPDKFLTLIAIILTAVNVQAQSPTNNPYADFYKTTSHWSDSLKWNKVTNAVDCKDLIGSNNSVDSAEWNNVQKRISEQGGGVLYFPPGKYEFRFDAKIYDGVIVRGAETTVTRAVESNYLPLTQFSFPKYNPAFENSGTPNASAFKRIFASVAGQKNFGIVNVDINRAVINFWGSWPKVAHENVIIFGVRQNNAAVPDGGVPSKVQSDKGKGWQRWPSHTDGNVTVCVYNTAVISNCRFNDAITDSFLQPEYMTNDGYVFKEGITFNYAYHRGITIHQKFGSDLEKCEIKDNYIQSSRYFDKVSAIAKKLDIQMNKLVDTPEEREYTQITKSQYAYPLIEEVQKAFETKTFTSFNKDTIRYQLLKPREIEPNKKYPLIIFFHGLGENGKNANRLSHLVSLFNMDFNRENFPCYVLVPHIREHDHWYAEALQDQPTFSMQMTMQLTGQLLKNEPIDQSRIYTSGIATGGKGALEALIRFPKAISAAVLVASYWPFADEDLKKLKGKSVWISAGSEDPHVPVNYYRLMNKRLSDFSVDVSYNEYAKVEVYSWLPLLYDRKFLPWLFSKKG